MPPINFELTFHETDGVTNFEITATKLYNLLVALSTEDDTKLLQQSNSGQQSTINWHKYQSKLEKEAQNQYLDYSVDPISQEINSFV